MIINSLLDSDFYKFSMGQVALHQFPWVNVEYEFKCRNHANLFNTDDFKFLKKEVKHFCSLRFSEDEINYLSSIRFFKQSYIDFLKLYQPDASHITMKLVDNELQVKVKGPWFLTIYFEVPLLAMISGIYSSTSCPRWHTKSHIKNLNHTIEKASEHNIPFADFGTRRRHSFRWHREVIEQLKKHCSSFIGTSNLFFAKEFGITPIGTMAHELMQTGQALDVPLADSQKRMLQAWVDEYRGDLGIALTDVIGIDAFLKDFDLYFAKLYDGLRHDSGCPFEWGEKVIEHYENLKINPMTKTLVFSDGLNIDKSIELYNRFSDRINVSFGIGTNLTNNFDEYIAPSIVMKMVRCNGRPVAKISDSPGKTMCNDEEYVSYLKKVFGVKR
jgi:nicotinate phosphoribosyltransferase